METGPGPTTAVSAAARAPGATTVSMVLMVHDTADRSTAPRCWRAILSGVPDKEASLSAVPAADATLRLLRHLSRTGPMPAASLAVALDLPRSTTYHLLTVLT